jgi:hypothetical protein
MKSILAAFAFSTLSFSAFADVYSDIAKGALETFSRKTYAGIDSTTGKNCSLEFNFE